MMNDDYKICSKHPYVIQTLKMVIKETGFSCLTFLDY